MTVGPFGPNEFTSEEKGRPFSMEARAPRTVELAAPEGGETHFITVDRPTLLRAYRNDGLFPPDVAAPDAETTNFIEASYQPAPGFVVSPLRTNTAGADTILEQLAFRASRSMSMYLFSPGTWAIRLAGDFSSSGAGSRTSVTVPFVVVDANNAHAIRNFQPNASRLQGLQRTQLAAAAGAIILSARFMLEGVCSVVVQAFGPGLRVRWAQLPSAQSWHEIPDAAGTGDLRRFEGCELPVCMALYAQNTTAAIIDARVMRFVR